MAWVRADSAVSGLGSTSATATLPLAVSSGDLLVAYGHCATGDPPANPFSDNVNGSWGSSYIGPVNLSPSSSGRLVIGWVLASAAAAANGLTLTFSGFSTATRTYCVIERYTNTGTKSKVDHAITSNGAGTTTAIDSGLTASAAAAGDLLIGGVVVGPTTTITAGNDGTAATYTLGSSVNNFLFSEYLLNATAGTKKATATAAANTGYGAGVVIFRATTGTGTSPVWGTGVWGSFVWTAAADTSPPTTPTGLTATTVSSSQVNLSWNVSTDNVGVSGYTVYRDGVQIATTTLASYSDTGLVAGSTHSYQVDAFDAAGNHSGLSSAASATTSSVDTVAPSTPTGLTASATSSSRVDLRWTASTDNVAVAGYTVRRGGSIIGTSTLASYVDTSVIANTTYTYTVDAYDASGNHSAQSATASVTTPTSSPPPWPSGWPRLARASSLDVVYSADQVYQIMLGSRTETFIFDWLSADGFYKGDLTPWIVSESPPRLTVDYTQAVQRQLSFQTWGYPSGFLYLSDQIRAHYLLRAPDGGWLNWTLATLTVNPPRMTITEGATLYDWTATDLGDRLSRDTFDQSFSVGGGMDALSAISSILATVSGAAVPRLLATTANRPINLRGDISWDRGKSKLEAVNDVCAAIGFRPVWFDELGQMRMTEIPDYNGIIAPWSWDATQGQSVVLSVGMTREPDPNADIINAAVAISEDATVGQPVSARYDNTRPDSPVSQSSLNGMVILKEIRNPAITDHYSAFVTARAAVQEGARVYRKFTCTTLHWPAWSNWDMIHFVYQTRDESPVQTDYNYLVSGWTMEMIPGGTTQHTMQQIINA